MGYRYTIGIDRTVTKQEFVQALWSERQTEIVFDAALSRILTAGQSYYWGVQLREDYGSRTSASFRTAPIAATATYGTVTVLTHGFQFDPAVLVPDNNYRLLAPRAFMEMGELVAAADGGGVVLQYDKQTGRWVDVNSPRDADGNRTVYGAAALKTGKSVVLVSDWYAESAISDTGFSEAAADSIFASLVELNVQTGGKLFGSALHFIGHSRGTSVNSEVIQRLGTYFPSKTDIQMTSLDPHEFDQASLDIPLSALLKTVENVLVVAKTAAVASLAVGNPTAGVIARVVDRLNRAIERMLLAADALGIAIDPIPYADFKDPDVVYWNNIRFADNYYQQAATETSQSNNLAYAFNVAGTVFTAIGDPREAAAKALQFFNQQKAIIVADAKRAFDALVVAVKADTGAAIDRLRTQFVTDAKQAVRDLEQKIQQETEAQFNAFIDTLVGDAKAAAQGLANRIRQNAIDAAGQLLTDLSALVETTATQFGETLLDTIVTKLSTAKLENALTVATELGNLTVDRLKTTFVNLIEEIRIRATQALDALVLKNKADAEAALRDFGAQVVADAKTALETLGRKVLEHAQETVRQLLVFETERTEKALADLVALLKSEAVEKLVGTARQEFDRLKALVEEKAVTVPTFTATPNGRPIATTDINQSLDQLSGFGSEDFTTLGIALQGLGLGVGGAHSRVWQWYAGTINTSIQSFQGANIWRRLSDTGLRATAFGIPLTGQEYSSTGWYFADPKRVLDEGNPQGQYIAASAGIPLGNSVIKEGVGAGFYFAFNGGGFEFAPANPSGEKTETSESNTEAGLDPDHVPAVETVFNGNFQQGIRQSLFTHIYDPTADWGRFPLSYQLPGWSFHGGSGFRLGAKVNVPGFGQIGGSLDVTGLFVVPTNVKDQVKPVVDSYISSAVDKVADYLKTLYLKKAGAFRIPEIPDPNAVPELYAQFVKTFGADGLGGEGTDFFAQLESADRFATNVQKWLDGNTVSPLASAQIGAVNLGEIFKLDGKNLFQASAIEKFKGFLINNADAILTSLLPQPGQGILFGGATALQTVLRTAFELATGNDDSYKEFTDAVFASVTNLSDFSTLTHDRLFVPQDASWVNFNLYVPLALTPSTKVRVTIALADANEVANRTGPLDAITNTAVAVHEDIRIDGAFFQNIAGHVAIPAAFKGRSVLISFKAINTDSNRSLDGAIVGPGDSAIAFDGSSNPLDAFSALFILQNVSLGTTPDDNDYVAVPPSPQLAERSIIVTGTPTTTLSLEAVTAAAELAKEYWIDSGLVSGAAARLDTIRINIGLLSGGAIGAYSNGTVTLDASGAGLGWYAGLGAEDYGTGPDGTLLARPGTEAAARFDLLTVLQHEFGHALGLDDIPTGLAQGALMASTLKAGVRKLPSAKDLNRPVAPIAPVVVRSDVVAMLDGDATASALAAAPVAPAGPLQNGDFAVSDPAAQGFGWTSTGTVGLAGGIATLSENRTQLSSLRQTLSLGGTETTLRFTLQGGTLAQAVGSPPEAFEVALRDAATGASVLGAIGLGNTDALINLQADGRIRFATGVTVGGLASGDVLDLAGGPVLVTIDLAQIARGRNLTLSFDLITFGDNTASIRLGAISTGLANGPVLVPDSATVTQGAALLLDVLANDGGTGLTITGVTAPAQGTAVIQDGKILYTAPAGYLGADSFTYTVTDSNNVSATATVALTIEAGITPIALTADTATVLQDGSVLIDVLGNDSGLGLTLQSVTPPTHGTAVIENGRIRYTPAAGYSGPDSFGYTVRDSQGQVAGSGVAVTVQAVVAPPVLAADAATLVQDGSVLIDVLGNDSGSGLTLTAVGTPLHGTAVIENGKIRYTPTAGYTGADSFGYTVTDIASQTASSTVAITVQATTAPPSLAADTATLVQNGSVLIDVLGNDAGTGLVLDSVTTPLHGTAVIQAGKVLYTPTAGYSGADSFGYTVRDAESRTASSTVSVTVTARPALVGTADSATLAQDDSVLIDVLANDNGSGLALLSVTQPAHGAAVLEAGKIRYTPTAGYVGLDAFTYTVVDAFDGTATVQVGLTVTAVAPTAGADSGAVVQGRSVLLDLLANDGGTGLVLTSVGRPNHGTAVIQDGKLFYSAAFGFVGTDTLSYVVTAANGLTASGSVTLTVLADVPPLAGEDAARLVEDGALLVDVLANDTGTGLVITALTLPAHGTAIVQDGKILYTAAIGYTGGDQVSYTVTDANGQTATGTLLLTIVTRATAEGDVHLKTFDGFEYDFQATGDFVLVEATAPGDSFIVQVRLDPWRGMPGTSITTAIAARVGEDVVTFDLGGRIAVDGVFASLPPFGTGSLLLGGGSLTATTARDVVLAWTDGRQMAVRDMGEWLDIALLLGPQDGAGTVRGLLGTNSGMGAEFRTPDGTLLGTRLSAAEIMGVYADAWRVASGRLLLPPLVVEAEAVPAGMPAPDPTILVTVAPQPEALPPLTPLQATAPILLAPPPAPGPVLAALPPGGSGRPQPPARSQAAETPRPAATAETPPAGTAHGVPTLTIAPAEAPLPEAVEPPGQLPPAGDLPMVEEERPTPERAADAGPIREDTAARLATNLAAAALAFSVAVPRRATRATTRLPLIFRGDGTARRIAFTAGFDPARLGVAAIHAGPDLPEGATIALERIETADGDETVAITVDSPVAIPEGDRTLGLLEVVIGQDLGAETAPLLDLAIAAIDGMVQPMPDRQGLRVLGALAADPADPARPVLRLIGGAESGAAIWRAPRTAPRMLPGQDVVLVTRVTGAGVTVPADLPATAGGLATLPVTLAAGQALSRARLTLRFDPVALSLLAVRADPGARRRMTVTPAAEGVVTVEIQAAVAAGPVDGLLALFDLQPAPGLAAGTRIDLALAAETTGMMLEPTGDAVPAPPRLDLTPPGDDPAEAANHTRTARARLLGGEAA